MTIFDDIQIVAFESETMDVAFSMPSSKVASFHIGTGDHAPAAAPAAAKARAEPRLPFGMDKLIEPPAGKKRRQAAAPNADDDVGHLKDPAPSSGKLKNKQPLGSQR